MIIDHNPEEHLLLGRKAMTNLGSILKRRDIANKGLSSQSYGFSSGHVWMWELDYKETRALKNWCFWTWCWRRLLRVHWTARRYTQSILKEISPEYSLEGLMMKLKLQYLGHLMRRANSLEKTLMLGRTEGRRKSGWQKWLIASPTQWTWVWLNSRKIVKDREREAWRAAVHEIAKSRTRLSNWTDPIDYI